MVPPRFPWELSSSPLARLEDELRARGVALLDLTVTNPAALGLGPAAQHFADLPAEALAAYDPDPRGASAAREAVVTYLAGHGAELGEEDLFLSASTSEAYAWLFKVLAEPGDAVAIPRPSYPLFDFLTHLEGVRPLSYELFRDERWQLQRASVRASLEAGAKALVLVQPSNPVGAGLDRGDRDWLLEACGAAGAAIIADEVFLDFGEPEHQQSLAHRESAAAALAAGVPVFVLSGASKVVAAPQVKAGWIALAGAVSEEHRRRLEVVADTFLSVSAAAQLLLPRLLAQAAEHQRPLRARIQQGRDLLSRACEESAGLELVSDAAGWAAVLRLPLLRETGTDWSEKLLGELGLITHPGHFYELSERHLILSLLTEPAKLAEGVARITKLLTQLEQA